MQRRVSPCCCSPPGRSPQAHKRPGHSKRIRQAKPRWGSTRANTQAVWNGSAKELNLTDDQKAKVKPILDDEEKQFKAAQEDASLSQDQRHDKMKQIHDTADSQINGLLTPDQQKKFAQLKERRKGHHEGQKANPPDESKQPYR